MYMVQREWQEKGLAGCLRLRHRYRFLSLFLFYLILLYLLQLTTCDIDFFFPLQVIKSKAEIAEYTADALRRFKMFSLATAYCLINCSKQKLINYFPHPSRASAVFIISSMAFNTITQTQRSKTLIKRDEDKSFDEGLRIKISGFFIKWSQVWIKEALNSHAVRTQSLGNEREKCDKIDWLWAFPLLPSITAAVSKPQTIVLMQTVDLFHDDQFIPIFFTGVKPANGKRCRNKFVLKSRNGETLWYNMCVSQDGGRKNTAEILLLLRRFLVYIKKNATYSLL